MAWHALQRLQRQKSLADALEMWLKKVKSLKVVGSVHIRRQPDLLERR